MKKINLSQPANLIWSFGFFLCLITTSLYFYIFGYKTFPSINRSINIINIILNFWFLSIPLGIVGVTFFIRYYLIIRKKFKSSQKEYLAIISTILVLALFPSIIVCTAILEITKSYFSFIPTVLIIALIVIINILKNIKQTSF